jgi:hypothetical protein
MYHGEPIETRHNFMTVLEPGGQTANEAVLDHSSPGFLILSVAAIILRRCAKQNRQSRVFVSVSWNQGGEQEKDQKQLTNFLVFSGKINPKRRLRCDRLQQN